MQLKSAQRWQSSILSLSKAPAGVSRRQWPAAVLRLRDATRGVATLLVDGSQPAQEVTAQLLAACKEATDVLAVGQKGTITTLRSMARLESNGRTPMFTIARISSDEVHNHAPRSDFTVPGANHFRLQLPATSEWESRKAERIISASRLLVGNSTQVMPLAKAIAARAKMLDLGRSFAVETSVSGLEDPTRLRVSRLVYALARAHHWQVSPMDASRPTRQFRCTAALVEGDREAVSGEGAVFLRLEVVPEGPVGGTLPASSTMLPAA